VIDKNSVLSQAALDGSISMAWHEIFWVVPESALSLIPADCGVAAWTSVLETKLSVAGHLAKHHASATKSSDKLSREGYSSVFNLSLYREEGINVKFTERDCCFTAEIIRWTFLDFWTAE